MGWLNNARKAKALYDADKEAHLGDIAVLKTDMGGVDVREPLRPLLDPVRGWTPAVDLEALAQLPPNTFGYAFAAFMRKNGLSPFVITDAIDDDMRRRNAFGIRYATTHDMFHVLLDFDTSWAGELGVLGFAVGQNYTFAQKIAAALAWLLYPIWSGLQIGSLWRAWSRPSSFGAF